MKNAVLNCEHVTQRFAGLTAVNDVSMQVYENEIVGVIGPNGAGKNDALQRHHGDLYPDVRQSGICRGGHHRYCPG